MVMVMMVVRLFFGLYVVKPLSEPVTSQKLFATRLLLIAQCTSSYASPHKYCHFSVALVAIVSFRNRQAQGRHAWLCSLALFGHDFRGCHGCGRDFAGSIA